MFLKNLVAGLIYIMCLDRENPVLAYQVYAALGREFGIVVRLNRCRVRAPLIKVRGDE